MRVNAWMHLCPGRKCHRSRIQILLRVICAPGTGDHGTRSGFLWMGNWSLKSTHRWPVLKGRIGGATTNLINMAGHVSHPARRTRVTGSVGLHTKKLVLTPVLWLSQHHTCQVKRNKAIRPPSICKTRWHKETLVHHCLAPPELASWANCRTSLPFFQERRN